VHRDHWRPQGQNAHLEILPSQELPSNHPRTNLPLCNNLLPNYPCPKQFAETTTSVVDEIQEFHSNTSEKYIVDTEVFTSIVSRIEALERTTSVKSGNDVSAILSSSSSPPVASSVTNDIIELKTHLIRLQTYVMETNAKLQDMVFSGNGSSIVNFGDIFSDSHPTPPTLLGTTSVGALDAESIPGSEGSTEIVDIVTPIDNDVIQTADNGEEAPL
jgi:hypothetical protein